jgi:hypothetical protein
MSLISFSSQLGQQVSEFAYLQRQYTVMTIFSGIFTGSPFGA